MSEVIPPPKKRRVSIARAPLRSRVAIVKGQDAGRFTDFYHLVLTSGWAVFLLELAILFATLNVIFALFYFADTAGIGEIEKGEDDVHGHEQQAQLHNED
jgi:hypothetical protein